jgi:segregation and condensation protein A
VTEAGREALTPTASPDVQLRFRLPIYEGPLDLLLHLIKRAELDPQDVTASIITEQYLQYLNLMQELNLDIAGEYLVMAATLLLIKSFTLLPHPQRGDDEEAEDLKQDLVERLLEYQRYREAAAKLAERPLLGRDVFAAPRQTLPEDSRFQVSHRVSIFDLVHAMAAVLKRLADRTPQTLALRDIPVVQCIPRILAALEDDVRIEFVSLFDDLHDRALMIATFLALLELMHRGEVSASQEQPWGPIYLCRGPWFGSPQAILDVEIRAESADGREESGDR